jgi:hypothetical protein
MVSLMRHHQKVAQGRELDAPLEAYRKAAEALPGRDAPLVDRLFALECLGRAGREALSTKNQLLPARRTAENYIYGEWESDVPHANVLGQTLATIDALDDDPPSSWPDLLEETLQELEPRQARHGITTTPLVLVSVIRGLSTIHRPVPRWLLDAARSYFERGPTAVIAAELAEALHRHRDTEAAALAKQAAEVVFSERHANEPGAAIARWWLAERWDGNDGPVASPDAIASARIQAVMSPMPTDPRLAAMLAEVSGRSAESLVLMPKTELELFRDRAKGHSVIENYGWRSLFLATPLVLAFVFLTTVLRWLGNADPSAKTLAGLASVLTLVASLVVVTGVWMTIKRLRGDLALFALLAGIAIPALLTIIVFFFYPT